MKRLYAVAAALLLVACAHGSSVTAGDSIKFSVYPPTQVLVETAKSLDGPGNLIPIGVVVTEDNLAPVVKKFDERVAAGDKELWFRIDSPGGSIFAGNEFIQHIDDAKREHGLKVTCVVDTKAYSMAFVMLESFCDSRLMTKRATLLAHNGSMTVQGNAKEIENQLEFLRVLDDSMAQVVSKRLGMPLGDYKAHIDGRDWAMSVEEALSVHAVDDTIDPLVLPPAYKLDPVQDSLMKLLGG